MLLHSPPSGRLEKIRTTVVGNEVTKEYINRKTGEIFRYVVTHFPQIGNRQQDPLRRWFSVVGHKLSRPQVMPPTANKGQVKPESSPAPDKDKKKQPKWKKKAARKEHENRR